MSVTRYDVETDDPCSWAGLEPATDGDWVRWDDYEREVERLTKERDEARRHYQFMVERAADRHLDGYRELGARAAAAENAADTLRARVAELENQETMRLDAIRDLAQLRIDAPQLRARVAELEAPPVVPEGWMIRKIGAPEWRGWEARNNGEPTSWWGRGDDLPIVRALAWAIEHDQRPPHAGDEGER